MNVAEMLKKLSMTRALILGVVVAILYYFMLFDSGNTQITNIQNSKNQVEQVQRELQENQKKLDRAMVYKKTAAEIGTTINRLLGVIPEKFGIADLTKIVSNEARIAGSSLTSITPTAPEISSVAKEFEELMVHLDISGSFLQQMVFLSNLTKINQILIVRKFDLAVAREAKGEELPLVRMTADIVAYRYRGNPAAAGQGQGGGAAPNGQAPGQPPPNMEGK